MGHAGNHLSEAEHFFRVCELPLHAAALRYVGEYHDQTAARAAVVGQRRDRDTEGCVPFHRDLTVGQRARALADFLEHGPESQLDDRGDQAAVCAVTHACQQRSAGAVRLHDAQVAVRKHDGLRHGVEDRAEAVGLDLASGEDAVQVQTKLIRRTVQQPQAVLAGTPRRQANQAGDRAVAPRDRQHDQIALEKLVSRPACVVIAFEPAQQRRGCRVGPAEQFRGTHRDPREAIRVHRPRHERHDFAPTVHGVGDQSRVQRLARVEHLDGRREQLSRRAGLRCATAQCLDQVEFIGAGIESRMRVGFASIARLGALVAVGRISVANRHEVPVTVACGAAP